MHVNRGLIFWGVALITAGAVALAIQFGTIDDEGARQAWRFWPVVLIIIGLAVIAARTPLALPITVVAALVAGGLAGSLVAGWPDGLGIGCGGEPTELVSERGAFDAGAADVELRLNCGELDLSTASGSEWTVDARHGSDAAPSIDHDEEALSVTVEGGGGGLFGFRETRQAWEVVLPTDVELDLQLDVNAASSRLDLSDASLSRMRLSANAGDVRLDLSGGTVEGMSIDANAGSLTIDADGATELAGTVGMNAGSLDLCVPDGATVEIELDDPNVTFSHNLDERGFDRSGDTWTLGSGSPAISLEVDGNAASFTYNPGGGCS